ncbi:MAG TPA: hypothetical protein PK751_04320 [Verrucomicrobiota bacterium]|jgi:hypothetical protein|nr:hypothetical protein [Verrucomicrobiota bacterium]HOH39493.1 hypothetical protein [Verrucomicrobiota bacterium]HQB72348.1 hypothetical protein [Verrucomicrobiota bacterium]
MTEWNIQARAHACAACSRPFVDQEGYHTLLFDEKADFRRLDVCQACWLKQYSEGARERKGFVSYWQGVYTAPPPPVETIHKQTAESLLRQLIELNDPQYIPAGYILAVMLERKRLLKVKEQILREGQRVFIYEQPATGDVFTIADPNLKLDQLEQVQRDVAALLEHGLPPAPPVCSAAAGTDAAVVFPAPAAESAASSTPAPAEPADPVRMSG